MSRFMAFCHADQIYINKTDAVLRRSKYGGVRDAGQTKPTSKRPHACLVAGAPSPENNNNKIKTNLKTNNRQ